MSSQRTLLGAIALAAAALSACSSNDSTAPAVGNRLSVGFRIAPTTSPSAILASSVAGAPGGFRIARQSDTIIVTRAQFVLSDVRLRTVISNCADDAAADGKKNDHSDCPEIKTGPFVVDMPVTGEDGARISVDVPAGTYGNIRMKLHKITDNNPVDISFQKDHPDLRGVSVRLEGTYNGTPFSFTADVTAMLTVPLTKPLVVTGAGADVTISVDMASWFVRAQGGLYSPAAANTPGEARGAVTANIERAFRAFRDQNHDGRED